MNKKLTIGLIIGSCAIAILSLVMTVALLLNLDSTKKNTVNEQVVVKEEDSLPNDVLESGDIEDNEDVSDKEEPDTIDEEESEEYESIIPKEEYEPYMGDDGHFHKYGDYRDDMIDGMVQGGAGDAAVKEGPASVPDYWDYVTKVSDVPERSANMPKSVSSHLLWFKEDYTEIYQCYLAVCEYLGLPDGTEFQAKDIGGKEHRFQTYNFGFYYENKDYDVFIEDGIAYVKVYDAG